MDGVWSGVEVSLRPGPGVLVVPRVPILFLKRLGDDVGHPLLINLEWKRA